MKKLVITLGMLPLLLAGKGQDATEIIRKAEEKMQGESNKSEMKMKIIRPSWERTISFKSWSLNTEYSMTLITGPAKEKGKTFLKRQNELWQYDPIINRMIKLPPSMMSQGWMGSDFSNDDILKETSISRDYTHVIVGNEEVDGHSTWKIELTPKEDAAVVWGKMIKWIEKDNFIQLKTEYYDEEGYLMKTETGSNVKAMDGRMIPTHFEIIPADEEGNKTVLIIEEIDYGISISLDFFSQQNMKKLR